MTATLGKGDAFRAADDQIEVFRATSARLKRAQELRDAEEKARGERLQAELKAQTRERHPEWFA